MSDTASKTVAAKDEGSLLYIMLISGVATIGGFLFGFDSGVINGTVDGLKVAFNSDSVGTGFDVASMLLGCAVGAFFAGWLADKFGRRAVLIVAAVCFIVSAWGSGIATSSPEFIVYRVIGGLAVGAASVMAPAYISEVARASYRGRMSTVQQVAIIVGLTAAFLSNYVLAQTAGSALKPLWWGYETWRWMFWMELFPAGFFLLALLFIPESPRYLAAVGKTEAARKVLTRLYGTKEAEEKIKEIGESMSSDHHLPKLSDIYDKGKSRIRPIIWVGIGLASFQQLVGINVIFYYGAVLWQSVGFSESDALLINVVSGSVSIAAVVPALLLIDKLGRKPLLWIGSVGMGVTLALAAVAFSTATLDAAGNPSLSDGMGVLAFIAANLYVIFFNFSWGPVMWVMLGEMFPNQIRGSGLAIAGVFQWVSNFAITMTFPMMLTGIGLSGAYAIYAVFAAISAWFVSRFVHETRGIELEQMAG
jgi:SP family sugar:H+ symporter-like MFS transporter